MRYVRIQRSTENLGLKVIHSSEGIHKLTHSPGIETYRHGVHGKVTASHVIVKSAVLHYRVAGITRIRLLPGSDKLQVNAVARHLGRAIVGIYRNLRPGAEP